MVSSDEGVVSKTDRGSIISLIFYTVIIMDVKQSCCHRFVLAPFLQEGGCIYFSYSKRI